VKNRSSANARRKSNANAKRRKSVSEKENVRGKETGSEKGRGGAVVDVPARAVQRGAAVLPLRRVQAQVKIRLHDMMV
jgi:hypothetical protein